MKKYGNVFIKNIYYMISYAFEDLKPAEDFYMDSEQFDNIENLFAAILSERIGRLLKRGLYKEYLEKKENLFILHGKIDLNETIQNKISRRNLLSCEYDKLTENNLLNQILKTASLLLIKSDSVENKYKSKLKQEMNFFSNIKNINPENVQWNKIRYQKNNNDYRFLMNLCNFLFMNAILTTENGNYKLANFDIEKIYKLYEKFILKYYKKEHQEIKTTSPTIKWKLDNDENEMLPKMKADVMLSKGNKILIIDAKYYSHTTQENNGRQIIHPEDLYQIFAYVKNLSLQDKKEEKELSGMLLYAKTDEDKISKPIKYEMSGNKIAVKTLDLNQDFESIKKQLDAIAEEYL